MFCLDLQAVRHGYEEKSIAPVAVLFSGGLDSMILAAVLDECLDTKCNWFLLLHFFILGMKLIFCFSVYFINCFWQMKLICLM